MGGRKNLLIIPEEVEGKGRRKILQNCVGYVAVQEKIKQRNMEGMISSNKQSASTQIGVHNKRHAEAVPCSLPAINGNAGKIVVQPREGTQN